MTERLVDGGDVPKDKWHSSVMQYDIVSSSFVNVRYTCSAQYVCTVTLQNPILHSTTYLYYQLPFS